MEKDLRVFTKEFFINLKSNVEEFEDYLLISKVPKSFEDIYGKNSPYKVSFSESMAGFEFGGKGSKFFASIMNYLDNISRTTLLKIDFEIDPKPEIEKIVFFKNCEISNILKRHKNNFFSRFTFKTNFVYLNEVESIVNEIYVMDGKIISGDLSGYKVIEGREDEAIRNHLKEDYELSKNHLKELISFKMKEVQEIVSEKLEEEISRIEKHYSNQLGELGGDLNSNLEKIKELEIELRLAEESQKQDLRKKIDRLKKNLLKIADDESKSRILKDQELTIKDAMQKYSLNVNNSLINTTVIYYPVFSFELILKKDNLKRIINLEYDPLKKSFGKFKCETCEEFISILNLCSSGHITCNNCFFKCGECFGDYCKNCLKRSCFSCGNILCKNCSKLCFSCGKYSCSNHLRRDSVSGEEKCTNCLRACMRCHGLSSPKYFGESNDGSKVCQKCLGEENRKDALKGVFER